MKIQVCIIFLVLSLASGVFSDWVVSGAGSDEIAGYMLSPIFGPLRLVLSRRYLGNFRIHAAPVPQLKGKISESYFDIDDDEDGDNILSLSIEPCNPVLVDDWATCVLQHGSEVNVEAAFIAPFDSAELETVSFANIASRLVPLPATGTDPCIGDLSPSCPIKEGRMYIYSTIFDILKYFPAGPMEVMFSIRDRNSKSTVGCAKLPVIIQRNPSFTYKKRNISS